MTIESKFSFNQKVFISLIGKYGTVVSVYVHENSKTPRYEVRYADEQNDVIERWFGEAELSAS
jgi:hypothetical protein